jgi:hypothetical protein
MDILKVLLVLQPLHRIPENVLTDEVHFVFIADYVFIIVALPYG